MANFRSYLQSQATLIHGNPTNNSRNPIVELSYGGGSVPEDSKASRFIFKVNTTSLREHIASGDIGPTHVTEHRIVLKNVIAYAQEYIGGQMYDAKRGSGITAHLYALTESFDEGTGYDYIFGTSLTSEVNPVINAPNWTHRRTNTPWTVEGGVDTATATVIADSAIMDGSEDLVFNVTAHMNQLLFGNRQDYGYMIAFDVATEELLSSQRQVVTFFSKYTDSFFPPYMETLYTYDIHERRCNFFLDETNSLFLASTKPLDSVDRVEIYDYNEALIKLIPQDEITEVRPGLYRIDIEISGDDYPDNVMFYDVWHYHLNNRSRKQEQDFILATRDLFSENNLLDSEFWCSYSGIKHNEVIPQQSPKRKIVINPKRMFGGSVTTEANVEKFQYRIYTQQGKSQVEIIPFTDAYKLGDVYFFELEFSWLIPQFYFMEVRVVENNAVTSAGQTIKFRIVT